MIRKDLNKVEIEYRDDSGRFVDFHSLRHTFITNLTRGGVSPRVAQSLARHSTITLTMDRYSHVNCSSERAALNALPSLNSNETESQVMLKTGTDDLPAKIENTGKKTDTKTDVKTAKQLTFTGRTCQQHAEKISKTLKMSKHITRCQKRN